MAVYNIPRIIYEGDIELASHKAREGIRQLGILKTLMGFNELQQDVRKVEYIDGTRISCRSCFKEDVVTIYVPEKEGEAQEECRLVSLLTNEGIEEDGNFLAKSFDVKMNKDCEVQLKKEVRVLDETEINYLSQCRYVHRGTDDGILRKVSLFQYHHYHWKDGTPYIGRTIRVIGLENSADIHFTELKVPGVPLPTILATLSENLKTLYLISFSPMVGWTPEQVYFTYHQYDLVDGEWKLIKCSQTSTYVFDFEALALDRSGRCGCWRGAQTSESFSKGDASTVYINCLDSHSGLWKDGTRYQYTYKTFDINTEKFVNSGKVRDLHLSPSAKDYVVCRALSDTIGEYPASFGECIYTCNCVFCQPFAPPYAPSTQDQQTDYIVFMNSGNASTATYELFNGLDESEPPTWDSAFHVDMSDFLHNRGNMVQNCPPDSGGCEYGSGERFTGSRTRVMGIPYTSGVLATNAEYGTMEEKSCSSCWPTGWTSILPCGGAETWGGWYSIITRCGGNIYDRTYPVNINEKLMLSPFEMVFAPADFIGNTFISYDQETDSLIRGVQYKRSGESMKWQIWAEIPNCPDAGFPECTEKDITDELEELLSAENFVKLEAIIFK